MERQNNVRITTFTKKKIDPKVEDVIKLLGAGTILIASLLMPGVAFTGGILIKEYQKYKREKDRKEWEKFNLWRLRQVIKRLERQKVIKVENDVVRITNKGRQRLLKFNLEKMVLNRKTDGKWRLIIYDISNLRRPQRDLFRSILKKLNLLQLQESVYLTPFVCDDEIEYLRQVFNISDEVIMIKVSEIENEQAYKNYFGV